MAYHYAHATTASDLPHKIIARIKSFLSLIGVSLVLAATTNRRLQLVERLSAKSDEELATMGIRREDIVRRVFIDMLDV